MKQQHCKTKPNISIELNKGAASDHNNAREARTDLLYDAKFMKTSAVGCAAQAASTLGGTMKNQNEEKKILNSENTD